MAERKFVQMVVVTRPRWPPCPYMVKFFKKSISPEPKGRWPWKLVCSIGCLRTNKFIQMMTLGWFWPILRQGQIWSLMLLHWQKIKQSDKKFLLTSKLCHLGLYACEPLLMDMREIWFSFQGDWRLHQGDYPTAFLTHHFKLFSIKLERTFKKYMNYSTLCFKFSLKLTKISTKYIKTERVQCN